MDCIVALPGQLFRSTQIPACLWFLSRDRSGTARRDETLFIDARQLGHMIDRTRRDLSKPRTSPTSPTPTTPGATDLPLLRHPLLGERAKVSALRPPFQGERAGVSTDTPGFCKSAPIEEIRKHGHVLTPGRYVGAAPQEDDGEPFEEKMARLTEQWREQQAEARRLDAAIEENLARLGFGK